MNWNRCDECLPDVREQVLTARLSYGEWLYKVGFRWESKIEGAYMWSNSTGVLSPPSHWLQISPPKPPFGSRTESAGVTFGTCSGYRDGSRVKTP